MADKDSDKTEDLSEELSKVSIDQEGVLTGKLEECEEHLKKNDYQAVYPLVKELLNISSRDERVISVCRRLLASHESSQSGTDPQVLISVLGDDSADLGARRESANKLVMMTSQPTSVFNTQLAAFGGGAILVETAFKYLESAPDIAGLIFSSLSNLARNKECLPQILQNLPPNLKAGRTFDLRLTESLSELLRNLFNNEQGKLDQNKTVLFGLYLEIVAASCSTNGIISTKKCLLHVLSIISNKERAGQFIRHPAFNDGVLGMCFDAVDEVRGLGLVFLSKLGEYNDIQVYLDQLLKNKFTSIQNQAQIYRFLKTIFQTSPELGFSIISEEGWLLEAVDLAPLESTEVQLEFVQILGLACGTAKGRKLISDAGLEFLRQAGKHKDARIKAHSVLARSKLSIESKSEIPKALKDLVPSLVEIVSDETLDENVKMTAIESLAYFSLHPSVRALLGKDSTFWKAVVTLGSSDLTQPAALFGISAIISNVSAYRRMLTAEEQQLQKLKKLAKEATDDINSDPNMSDELVKQRNALMVSIPGMAALLSRLVKTKKPSLMSNISNSLLAFATDRNNHGTLLKFGAAKVLLSLVASESKEDSAIATQALAKLAIHTDPSIGLPGQLKFEVIRPLLRLCESGKLLQQFECLLALTNLASLEMDLRLRIVELKGLAVIEMLLVSDNHMVQRAAAELMCNMAMTKPVFDYYTGPGATNKLHLLIALADSEDLKTALASGGALATLSQSPDISAVLSALPSTKRVLPILISPESPRESQHRGVEIYKNIMICSIKGTQQQKDQAVSLFTQDVITSLNLLNNATKGSHPPIQESLKSLFEVLRLVT